MGVGEEKGRWRRRRRKDGGEKRVGEVGDWWMGGITDIPGFCALLILLYCGGTSSGSSLYTFHPSTPRHSCPIITISLSSTSQLRGTTFSMSLFSSLLGLTSLLFTCSLVPHSQVTLDLAVDVSAYEGPLVWFLV